MERIVFSANGDGIIEHPFVEKITSTPALYIIQNLSQNNNKLKCKT